MLTLGSLFDGSGGFPLGATLAGIKPLWASEIEPFPIWVTHKNFPKMKHLGDISKIHGAEIDPVDIITFGRPCFPAGTLVLTDRGYVEIEKIRAGMKVLTHKGRWRKVTDCGAKIGKTVILKGNHYGLECTPNHPIYSAEMGWKYENRKHTRYVSEKKEWIPAENMLGRLWAVPHSFERLGTPRPKHEGVPKAKSVPPFDEDFFYLVGRWIGDGWLRDDQRHGRPEGQHSGQIIVCAGYEKEPALKAAVEAVTEKYSVERCRTAVKYKFTSILLCEWLSDNFGKYSYGKHIPAWALSMPRDLRQSLLRGILDTDGYKASERRYRITTVSKKLAHGLRLLGETLGYSSSVFHTAMPHTCIIEGRVCNQCDQYIVQLTVPSKRPRLSDTLHSWYRVKKVVPTDNAKIVYNLTVDEDNSYIAEGIVVHNCQDMSTAGKRAGLDGSRSGLFREAIRIIKEMRCATGGRYPRYIVWENVPGAFSSNKGEDFRAVLEAVCGIKEEVSIPRPAKWESAGEILGDGYSVAWRTLDAQYWGVPQRRKRIFLVADFTKGGAGKILFESEGLSGYSAEGFRTWQRASRNSECGVAGAVSWDGREQTGALTASGAGGEQRMPDKGNFGGILVPSEIAVGGGKTMACGFCPEASAKTRSAGAEIEKSPTLRAGMTPAAGICYGICSKASNSMKSANPHSGFYEANTARTIDTSGSDATRNQGGMIVVERHVRD